MPGAPCQPDKFIGRKALLSAFAGFVEQSRHKMMFVNGPRCTGKTSLLRKMKDELALRGFVPVLLDLEGKAGEPLPQVLFDLMTAISAEIKQASGLSIGDYQDDCRVFENKFLPSIAPALGKMVLLFDEFNVPGDRDLVREDPAFAESAYLKLFPYLHSLSDHTDPLKFIAASGRSLSDLREYYEPVKAISLAARVEGFEISETADVVASLAPAVRFTAGAVEELQRLTKGYPQFVQCMAGGAFTLAQEQRREEIDRPEIEGLVSAVVQKYGAAISRAVGDILPQERALLILTAKLREHGQMATEKAMIHEFKQLGIDAAPADITRAAAGLLDSNILVFSRNFMAYSFFTPILEKWFVREYTMKSIPEEIRTVDARFDDSLRAAKVAYNDKDFDKAAALFRLLSEKYPQRFEAHYGLALALEAGGKAPQSEVMAAFEKAYRLDPDRSRRAYKTVLKRAYEKEGASPVLEKIVDLGDSTIEDRKRLLGSYLDMWRKQIAEGRSEQFLTALKNKPWLLKEYQNEIIRFIDDLINDIAETGPFAASDLVESLKDHVDGVQHHIWRVRLEGRVKKANNRTTEINSIPPELFRMKHAAPGEAKRPEEKPWTGKKRFPLVAVAAISLGLLLALGGALFFMRSSGARKPAKTAALTPERAARDLEMKRLAAEILRPDTVPARPASATVPAVPVGDRHGIRDADRSLSAVETTGFASAASVPKDAGQQTVDAVQQTAHAPLPAVLPPVAPSPAPEQTRALQNETPAKNEARIMLINASSMYQKGLSAKARNKLVSNGFSLHNVLTGNNRDKVSRVYAYYSAKQYVPVLKEALAVLYPEKEKSFFDISSKDRTVNGWIKNIFKDEKLHILIRMPNEE